MVTCDVYAMTYTCDVPHPVHHACAGAGGYDAVFCIVLDAGAQRVVELWEGWQELQVCPLPIEFDHRGVVVHVA